MSVQLMDKLLKSQQSINNEEFEIHEKTELSKYASSKNLMNIRQTHGLHNLSNFTKRSIEKIKHTSNTR